MKEVYISEAAAQEFKSAWHWYKSQDSRAATRFKEAFRRGLRSISTHPLNYPSLDPIHRVYLLNRYPYKVIYRVYEDRIAIVAVVHASREPDVWKDR